MTRVEFSRKARKEAADRAGGICEMCRLPIEGRAEFDHRIPWAMTRDSSVDNIQVLCVRCHRLKTGREDVPRIRKADRQRDKATGAKRARNPMPGSRSSKWKRRMDGTVERR